MNHRHALKISTDAGLGIVLFMIAGVVLWTADELLGWDLLPEWIDKFAQLLVIIFALLAGFAVVVSVMCSFAVIAESAAERMDARAPASNRRFWRALAAAALVTAAAMFGLHKFDQFRTTARTEERSSELRARMPDALARFPAAVKESLASEPSEEGDEAIARLLNALELSMPHQPEASVVVPAEAPYTHCVITALPDRRRDDPSDPWQYLHRRYLAGFPSEWERDAVQAGFSGQAMDVTRNLRGVVLDTRIPASWGPLEEEDRVVALLVMRGRL
jgi:hypothetical protein